MTTNTSGGPSEPVGRRKLKVLALHGYRQNAETFRQKTGSFRKLVQKHVQFFFITAPHKVERVDNDDNKGAETEQTNDGEQYGWWFNRDDLTFRGIRKGGPAIGFEDSVRLVEKTFADHGPFDGILGFSQGGCFVGLLCALQQKGFLQCQFKFAVIISGFKSGSLPHLSYYEDNIILHSLHIYGENDQRIPFEMSVALTDHFEDSSIVIHSGGHYVPGNSSHKTELEDFFENRRTFLTK